MIFGLLIVHYSGGRHQVYLTDHQIREFTKSRYGEWIAVFATLMWTKVSLCLFLLHIPTNKVVIRSLQGMIIFLIVSNVIGTILWVVQCRPLQGAWIEDVQATCFSREQKEVIILVQGSELSWPWAIRRTAMLTVPSHFRRLRLRSCVLPNLDPMESPTGAPDKSWSMLSDGSRRSV